VYTSDVAFDESTSGAAYRIGTMFNVVLAAPGVLEYS
jgi:hypothetical protein